MGQQGPAVLFAGDDFGVLRSAGVPMPGPELELGLAEGSFDCAQQIVGRDRCPLCEDSAKVVPIDRLMGRRVVNRVSSRPWSESAP